MKLGLGLYRSLLNDANFRFARQAGATHIIAQLVDYVKGGDSPSLTQNYLDGWGATHNEGKLWTYDELLALRRQVESHGLTLAGIENFDPAHWYDVLLDGPKKAQQMEGLKATIRNIGRAGIPVMGYYFSLAGVWGWSSRPSGRGQAMSVEFNQETIDVHRPIPNGMVWNMAYDTEAPAGVVAPVSREEMWERLRFFLGELLPVAEESGVRLAAHPDDPPVAELRGTARLFYLPGEYERLLEVSDSPSNTFEFCMGTLQEMKESDIYAILDKYAAAGKIGYIHFRNVKGKVPHYREAFVDEGDIDMARALRILKKNNYDGVLIPDHTPEMSCKAPWHAGMAFALGYMKGAMQAIGVD
ncbi:MAG: mannonate dehydratase [Phaeodactylibacter sp.]|nr:mannonate dehydratase [Phaeodactylibacter sp.]MCB9276165.1 mannonate dehydratase [Lewinellaceae bacterium]